MNQFRFPEYERPCPVCEAAANNVSYLIVGMPAMDEEMRGAMETGLIALAGCMPPVEDWRDSDDAWSCRVCGSEWVTRRGRRTPLIYRARGALIDDV